jgi:hypothetical protein
MYLQYIPLLYPWNIYRGKYMELIVFNIDTNYNAGSLLSVSNTD